MPLPFQLTGPFGLPILVMEPHGDDRANAFAMQGDAIETPQGARMIDASVAPPSARHEFVYVSENVEQLAALEAFFDTVRGMAGGCWFATEQWEMDVVGYELPNAGSYYLYIRRFGYCETFFPRGAQFRQLLLLYGDRWRYHTVTDVIPSYAAGVDKLHMTSGGESAPPPPVGFDAVKPEPSNLYRPLWLRYGRLDDDECVAETINAAEGTMRLTLTFRELEAELATLS